MRINNCPSLFDGVVVEVTHDLERYAQEVQLFETELSRLASNGGCGAFNTPTHPGRLMAISNLIPGLQKRYIGPTSQAGSITSDERAAAAVLEFLEDNERCRLFNDKYDPFQLPLFVQTVRGEVQLLLQKTLDVVPLSLSVISQRMRSGPGASSDVTGIPGSYGRLGNSSMSFSTPEVRSIYRVCASFTRLTSLAEAVRFQMFGSDDLTDANAIFLSVPKTNEKDRGICTQPSGNMALQLATHDVLAEVLQKAYGCDLETQQSFNQDLAKYGSRITKHMENRTWKFCTVDLSRASNFSWNLIQDMFPAEWVTWLTAIRSNGMKMPDGSVVEKHMCSTMGNGFTFSLMTLFLSSIIVTLYKLAGLQLYDVEPLTGKRVKTWAVYGDDIIVDKSVVNALYSVLDSFGFLINTKKTFDSGLFRESCGSDWFDGYPVRPVFLETLETQADIFSLVNRLIIWGVQHSVALPRTLQFLRRSLKKMNKPELRVPNWEDVSHGFHVPHDFILPHAKLKKLDGNWYEALEPRRKEHVLYRERGAKVQYSVRNGDGSVDVFTYELISSVKWVDRPLNMPAVLLHTIGGSVRLGTVGIRPSGRVNYKKKWKYAPGWCDFRLLGGTATRSTGPGTAQHVYRLWARYVRLHLFGRKVK